MHLLEKIARLPGKAHGVEANPTEMIHQPLEFPGGRVVLRHETHDHNELSVTSW
jgi:hypothetical protein